MTTKLLPRMFLAGALLPALLATAAWGQQEVGAVGPPVMAAPAQPAPQYTDDQLEQLLAPIALYPDPLLAQILPASTYPLEVVSAAQWLAGNPNPGEPTLANLPWDPSVVALVHYPPVLQFLSSNLDWTQALGAAFLNQQAGVMNAIQRLRARAWAAGTLASTPQQQVVLDGNLIYIEPVDPQVVYVPDYNPACVYDRPVGDVAGWDGGITFSIGFGLGAWLDNDCDWNHHWVAVGAGWNHGWRDEDRRRIAEHPAVTRPWAHDPAKPGPTLPVLRDDHRPVLDEHRGYAAPAVGHEEVHVPAVRLPDHPAARPVPVRPAAPREERPAAEPARAQPASELFNAGQSGAQAEREAQRGYESRAAAEPPRPAAESRSESYSPPPSRPSYSPPSSSGSSGGSGAWGGGGGQAESTRGNQSMRH